MTGAFAAAFWTFGLTSLGAAAINDLADRSIPNRLVFVVFLGSTLFRLAFSAHTLWLSLVSAIIVFLALSLFASQDVIGGGDAKLTAAATLLVPPERVGALLVEIALAGGLLALLYNLLGHLIKKSHPAGPASARKGPPRKPVRQPANATVGGRLFHTEAGRIARGEPMPYTLATLVGVAYHFAIAAFQCASAISCAV